MNKKFLTKTILSIVFFMAILILWVLSVALPGKMGGLNLSWLIAVYSALVAFFVLIPVVPMAKLSKVIVRVIFIVATVLVIGAVLALVGMLIKDMFVLPLIAVIITAVALPCAIALDAILYKIKAAPENEADSDSEDGNRDNSNEDNQVNEE